MTNEDGSAKFADYADYMIHHHVNLALALWLGSAVKRRTVRRGEPNPEQIDRYRKWWFLDGRNSRKAKFYKHANTAYQDWAVEKGFFVPTRDLSSG